MVLLLYQTIFLFIAEWQHINYGYKVNKYLRFNCILQQSNRKSFNSFFGDAIQIFGAS